ncbi:MAG: SufE family protein [Planctomycetes bacterium]|nr:SufE family protein [Planctomycetota bacterium]
MSILHKQAEIIEEFENFENWEDRYKHIIQIGRKLETLDDQHKIADNIVRGCSSTVWLYASHDNGIITFGADSDAIIVRGLVSLLITVYSGEKPEDIIAASPEFIEELGLNQNLSSNRANGLAAMVKQMKAYALAYS